MKKFFVNAIYFCIGIFALFTYLEAKENIRLSGKLVKRYYPAPCIVKNVAFGWYLEVDKSSQKEIRKQFHHLSKKDQHLFETLNIDLSLVQCVDCSDEILLKIRSFEDAIITLEGKLESPCLSRKYLCFSVAPEAIISKSPTTNIKNASLDKFDYLSRYFYVENESSEESENEPLLQLPEGDPEKLVTLQGRLILRLFPGPPEYTSIERGDRANYCWLLQMDEESFRIATTTLVQEPSSNLKSIMSWSNHRELYLSLEENMIDFCCDHESKKITVKGYLFHAHTAHHPTPILIDVKKILNY